MDATVKNDGSTAWETLPGLFSWVEVLRTIERLLEGAKREVRAQAAKTDRRGLVLYQVFVSQPTS
jgi:hypothetical protein